MLPTLPYGPLMTTVGLTCIALMSIGLAMFLVGGKNMNRMLFVFVRGTAILFTVLALPLGYIVILKGIITDNVFVTGLYYVLPLLNVGLSVRVAPRLRDEAKTLWDGAGPISSSKGCTPSSAPATPSS